MSGSCEHPYERVVCLRVYQVVLQDRDYHGYVVARWCGACGAFSPSTSRGWISPGSKPSVVRRLVVEAFGS